MTQDLPRLFDGLSRFSQRVLQLQQAFPFPFLPSVNR